MIRAAPHSAGKRTLDLKRLEGLGRHGYDDRRCIHQCRRGFPTQHCAYVGRRKDRQVRANLAPSSSRENSGANRLRTSAIDAPVRSYNEVNRTLVSDRFLVGSYLEKPRNAPTASTLEVSTA
jgi:hypothetical protein